MFEFETYDNKKELICDLELMECFICGKNHFGNYEICPHCGASVYNQCGANDEIYSLEELKQKARNCKEYEARKMIEAGKEILKRLGLEQ